MSEPVISAVNRSLMGAECLITQMNLKTQHKIIEGDCVEQLKKIETECVDLIITAPPFNIGKKYNTYADRKSKIEYLQWCQLWLKEGIHVLKKKGVFIFV